MPVPALLGAHQHGHLRGDARPEAGQGRGTFALPHASIGGDGLLVDPNALSNPLLSVPPPSPQAHIAATMEGASQREKDRALAKRMHTGWLAWQAEQVSLCLLACFLPLRLSGACTE